MKTMFRSSVLSFLLIAVSAAFGGVPPVNVTVSDAGGKTAFKSSTDRNGAFATGSLKPGNYVVQFRSSDAALKGKYYSLLVSAGMKKFTAGALPGERFAGGGVAMKVDFANVLSITGQVASEAAGPLKGGKKMVWIPKQIGSNIPGHWAEEGSAEAVAAKNAGFISNEDLNRRVNSGRSPDTFGN